MVYNIDMLQTKPLQFCLLYFVDRLSIKNKQSRFRVREVRSERGVVTLTKSLRLAVYGLHPADLR